ncbi:MAG: zinc-dependent metalloprotease [Planctomycetota bacterium]
MRQASILVLLSFVVACKSGDERVSPSRTAPTDPADVASLAEPPPVSGPPLLDVELGAGSARLWLPAAGTGGEHVRLLHVAAIETGLGSNDVGLDRGQMGGARLVRFRTVGDRVLLEELNTSFRADSDDPLERLATAQSFATSVLWGGEPVDTRRDGEVLVDLTDLLVRDAHGIADSLERADQGSYALDRSRSALDAKRCRAFPDNLDFAALLTFTSDDPGSLARSTAPEGGALTFVQRQGFIRLPDQGFDRRRFDPRMGAFGISYVDYAAPLDAPLVKRFAVRHRIDVDETTGTPRPIVYYIDRAAPEPVRSALVEGARWWADAFAEAGYPGLFRVEVAPPWMDPLDVRFHFVQWVHRSTRGWSYGNAVTDPRTGEIVKGHVSLGSLRVRQDRLLFEGLLGVQDTGSGEPRDPVQLALARIRQLSAHEIGHTLGLAHNFAASVSQRASVMDYPAPRVRPDGRGGVDVSDAYDVGVGAWDRHSIRMLYGQVPEGETTAEFHDRLHRAAVDSGLRYLTDADARPAAAAQPYANLWDDGEDPAAALLRALEVRRTALGQFGESNLAAGRPLAELEEVFVPLFLHHRYQVDAAAKMVGGVLYDHAMNDASGSAMQPVPLDDQRRALTALLETLDAEVLRTPDAVRGLLLPRPPGYGSSRETFERRAGVAFDWLGAAEVAARMTARGLLHPERLHRVELQAREATTPSAARFDAKGVVGEIFESVRSAAIEGEAADGVVQALSEAAFAVVVEEALRTYLSSQASRPVREAMRGQLAAFADDDFVDGRLELDDLRAEVRSALDRPASPEARDPAGASPRTPPGSPIGTPAWCSLR